MSRSRRHTPIFGIACAESEKADKRRANRKLRRRVRQGQVELRLAEVSNPWGMAKDGRHWWRPRRDDTERRAQWVKEMRK